MGQRQCQLSVEGSYFTRSLITLPWILRQICFKVVRVTESAASQRVNDTVHRMNWMDISVINIKGLVFLEWLPLTLRAARFHPFPSNYFKDLTIPTARRFCLVSESAIQTVRCRQMVILMMMFGRIVCYAKRRLFRWTTSTPGAE